MNLWDLFCPYARLDFGASSILGLDTTEALVKFTEALEAVPGVKRAKRGAQGWNVPLNAVAVVNDLSNRFGVEVSAAKWISPPQPAVTWADVEARLREAGEVRDWVYAWLTQYQKDAIAFGWSRRGVNYWHSTGSGKTATGVLTSLSTIGTVIVITRAVSRIQFAREIERFLHVKALIVRPASHPGPTKVNGETFNQFRSRHKGQGLVSKAMAELWLQHKAAHGEDKPLGITEYVRACRLAETRAFIVLGWEAVPRHLDELKSIGPACLIADEIHKAKASKRHSIIHLPDLPEDDLDKAKELQAAQEKDAKERKGFIKQAEDGRKLFVPIENIASAAAELARSCRKTAGLTATAIKDRPRDLWGQLDLVEPNSWGSSSTFRGRYCDMKPGKYGGMDDRGKSNVEELNLRLKTVSHILSYHETHRHLPPKRRVSTYVAPEDQVAELGGFNKELKDAKKRGASALLEVRLAMAASRKRKAVLDIIESHVNSGQKVCVFTARRRDCDELGSLVKRLGTKAKPLDVWVAHGGSSPEVRQGIVDEYMAHPGPCVMVATGDSVGESLNLDTTDAALFVMLPYTPGQLRQWEGRFHRASTKKPVLIYYVIAEGTVDEHVASLVIEKLDAVSEITKDTELAEAKKPLSGIGELTPDEFAASVLASLDI